MFQYTQIDESIAHVFTHTFNPGCPSSYTYGEVETVALTAHEYEVCRIIVQAAGSQMVRAVKCIREYLKATGAQAVSLSMGKGIYEWFSA